MGIASMNKKEKHEDGGLHIVTNYHPRDLLYIHELTPRQQEQAMSDYADYTDMDDCMFFVYRGWVYNLLDFMHIDDRSPFGRYWHGYSNDTYFSGVLVHLCVEDEGCAIEDQERVIVGYYYS